MPPHTPHAPNTPNSPLLDAITRRLEADQAEQVAVINISDKTNYADFLVIASGGVARKVIAMAEHLREDIRKINGGTPHLEGINNGDWVLIDAGDVIVHLFRPEVRAFYQLEKLWGAGAS